MREASTGGSTKNENSYLFSFEMTPFLAWDPDWPVRGRRWYDEFWRWPIVVVFDFFNIPFSAKALLLLTAFVKALSKRLPIRLV